MESLGLDRLTMDDKLENMMESVLRCRTPLLAKRLIPKTHFPYLKGAIILSDSDCQEITHEITTQLQTLKMIEILISKGRKGFVGLIASLEYDGTQMELVKALNISLEEEYNKTFRPEPQEVKTERSPAFELPRPLAPSVEMTCGHTQLMNGTSSHC